MRRSVEIVLVVPGEEVQQLVIEARIPGFARRALRDVDGISGRLAGDMDIWDTPRASPCFIASCFLTTHCTATLPDGFLRPARLC